MLSRPHAIAHALQQRAKQQVRLTSRHQSLHNIHVSQRAPRTGGIGQARARSCHHQRVQGMPLCRARLRALHSDRSLMCLPCTLQHSAHWRRCTVLAPPQKPCMQSSSTTSVHHAAYVVLHKRSAYTLYTQIKGSLEAFGISESSQHVLVASFDASPEDVRVLQCIPCAPNMHHTGVCAAACCAGVATSGCGTGRAC